MHGSDLLIVSWAEESLTSLRFHGKNSWPFINMLGHLIYLTFVLEISRICWITRYTLIHSWPPLCHNNHSVCNRRAFYKYMVGYKNRRVSHSCSSCKTSQMKFSYSYLFLQQWAGVLFRKMDNYITFSFLLAMCRSWFLSLKFTTYSPAHLSKGKYYISSSPLQSLALFKKSHFKVSTKKPNIKCAQIVKREEPSWQIQQANSFSSLFKDVVTYMQYSRNRFGLPVKTPLMNVNTNWMSVRGQSPYRWHALCLCSWMLNKNTARSDRNSFRLYLHIFMWLGVYFSRALVLFHSVFRWGLYLHMF